MVVTLVLARMQSGIMEASATLRPSSPYTLPYWSTTAMGSDDGPILQVQDMCCEVLTWRIIHSSRLSLESSSASVGSTRSSMMSRKLSGRKANGRVSRYAKQTYYSLI